MSATHRTASAYQAAPQRNALGGLWADKARLRRALMIGGVAVFAVIAAAVYLFTGRYVDSDDAYIHSNKLMVSTDVSGLVTRVNVHEGQKVAAGQVLFTLDPQAFQIALDNAKAALAQTVQDAQSTRAAYRAAVAQIAAQAAQANVNHQTLVRYQALAKQNAIAPMQIDVARAAELSAQATLVSLRQTAATQLAKLNGNPDLPAEQTPAYLKAKAVVDEAQRQLDHATIRAPFAGIVGEVEGLQPGTLVVSALAAFSPTSAVGLISDSHMWVSADMKETDLTHVRVGAPAEVTIDTYPGCKWQGHVQIISAGSDSSFSALPAENASGNWVKVVQRIPVRVNIDQSQCDRPLRVGMSAVVSVDTGHRRWYRLVNGL